VSRSKRVTCSQLAARALPPALAKFSYDFVKRAGCSLLPSALAVTEKNCLINPQHANFRKILVRGVEPLTYDPRMSTPQHRPETQIEINVALPAVPFRPRPPCDDCRRDPAARAEFALHFRPHWLAPTHYILKHTVDDIFLKNPQVAVAIQVLL
jgi:hypothetical protein